MQHKQTVQHVILFTRDQRTLVSLSPEGDTYSNNVQTSFAQGSELQEKEGKTSFKSFVRKKWCNGKLILFHFAAFCINVEM